jgi:hypothetical protein
MRKHIEIETEKQKRGETLSAEEIQKMREELQDPEVLKEEKYYNLLNELRKYPQYQQQIEQKELEEKQIRRQIGAAAFELAQTHVARTGYLMHELSIIDRIDGMIDRCLKRLLLVRGVKSISPSLSAAPKRIAAS